MSYSRAIFGVGRGGRVQILQPNRTRLVAFDKNLPGATSLLGTTSRTSLYGTAPLAGIKNSHALKKAKDEKKANEKEAEEAKARGENIPDPWYYPSSDSDRRVFDNYDENAFFIKDKDTADKFQIGQGVPDTSGEGWSLTFSGGFKQGENGATTFESGKAQSLEGSSNSIFKITAVNDRGQIKLPTHPLENGMVKHDHKVIQPKTLRVTGWVKSSDSPGFDAFLKNALAEKSLDGYFTLVSPWKKREKMYLQSFTSRANTQRYDVFEYVLELTELLIAISITDKTNKPELTSSTNKGAQGAKK